MVCGVLKLIEMSKIRFCSLSYMFFLTSKRAGRVVDNIDAFEAKLRYLVILKHMTLEVLGFGVFTVERGWPIAKSIRNLSRSTPSAARPFSELFRD